MKPNFTLHNFLALAGSSLLAIPSAQAQLYWDSNGATDGFGTTNGAWGTSNFWNDNSTGGAGTFTTATTGSDNVNFGTAANPYTGRVTVSGTQTAGSITLGNTNSSSLSITGGTLSLSGATITRNNKTPDAVDSITSAITGSPNVSFATVSNNTYRGGLQFAPEGNATQALGTISLSKTESIGDKGALMLGGVSTGNSVAAINNSGAEWGVIRKRGAGEWSLGNVSYGAFHNYAGTTIAQGTLNVPKSGLWMFGGTLILDYTTSSNLSKLPDGGFGVSGISLLGGTLQLDRSNDASGTHTEIVASTSLNGGWVNITRPDVNSTVKLQMNAITRSAGATLNFGAVNIADTDTTNTNGILGPWVTVGGADFAYNSTNAADGTINAYNGYTDVQRLTPGTIADGSATNVRLVEGGGSAGNIALGAATTNINTLNQSASGGSGAATIDMDGKTLAVNGLLAGAGSGALTIGSSANSGTLRTATASGELIVHNYSSNPLTINSVISNNTGASRLTVTGTGTTILAGLNTHTGETRISGGVLEAAIGTGLSSSTHLRLDGGVLQSTGSFTWTNGSNNTAGQFNWSSENGGGFAAKGSKLTVKVGNNPNTEQKWAGVAEASNGTFATAGNAILGPLKFGSTTADSEVEFQNRIDLNGETREIQVTDNTGSSGDFATLSGVIRNSSALVPAGIYKSGTGTLVLSNANTYDGVTTVAAGTLLVNNASGSGTGTGAVNMKAGAALGGDGSVGGSATFNNESIFAWNLSVTDPADTGSATVADTFAVTGDLADGDAAGGSVFKILLAGTQTFADTFWNANQSWTNVLTSGNSFDLENLFTSFTYANASGSISGPSNGSFSLSGSSLSYNFAAIPEPTSALAGLLLTAGLLRRRRK